MADEVLPHGEQHLGEHVISQAIEHLVTLFAGDDEATTPEQTEVLGQVGLLDWDRLEERADRLLSLGEFFDNVNPRGMGKDLKNPGFESPQSVVVHKC